MEKNNSDKKFSWNSLTRAFQTYFCSRSNLPDLGGMLSDNPSATAEGNSDDLTAEEWALAILLAYEAGTTLKPEAKVELTARCKSDAFRLKLRRELSELGYAKIFGIN